MSERFVEQAKGGEGVFERLIHGLPGIRGYADKELRRDADYRLRQQIASSLSAPQKQLFELQKKLLKGGGLLLLADVDSCITRLQTLIDRIKTASYGYAGLFDAVKIQADQLDALHRFDVALASTAAHIQSNVQSLEGAVAARNNIPTMIEQLSTAINELTALFNKRSEAIVAPDLLTDATYAPTAEELPAVDSLPKDSVG